jgi:hypothetical protein
MLVIFSLVSTSIAILASIVAWRATGELRRRSDARVAALARAIHASDDLPLAYEAPVGTLTVDSAQPHVDEDARFAAAPPFPAGEAQSPEMFSTAQRATPASRYGVMLAAVGFVIATIAATSIVFSGESPTAAPARVGASSSPADPLHAAPLELVALTHERVGGALTVRGIVRNPANGAPLERMTAVVFVFDPDGGFLASARAALEAPALIAGGESPFTVTVPVSGDVGRYRVSFRSADRAVGHVDKRSGS